MSNIVSKQDTDKRKEPSKIFFAILLFFYVIDSVLVTRAAGSQEVLFLWGRVLPVSTFAGVFTCIANICIIFLVVFYGKSGYITAMVVLIVQLPIMIRNIFMLPVLSNIPGLFNSLLTVIAITLIYRRKKEITRYQDNEILYLKEQQKLSQHLFEQTATALVNSIDAKDTYSHGHSLRVAEYSEKIARYMGKSDEECYRIYHTALLHDVGKIGISESIINKKGRLSDEEYEIIKQHPVIGNQILSSITDYPYLSIGAHYHHERYDGKGYPDGLKGEDIPEIARIISVADAYDAMSSNRSYRDVIPQQLVREEIVKGAGTQFDPGIAVIMQQLIDQDTEYRMKERSSVRELAGKDGMRCGKFLTEISDGILITPNITVISFRSTLADAGSDTGSTPAVILFDSLDGRVHDDEKTCRDLEYYEYCVIRFDGEIIDKGTRKIMTNVVRHAPGMRKDVGDLKEGEKIYDIDAVKFKDHLMVSIDDGTSTFEVIIALPDSSRYAYMGLTGENCILNDVSISVSQEQISEGYIPRIAEEISYIDRPDGDIPSIQIDGNRTDTSLGTEVTDGMRIQFHSKSLPTARLIWHCPFILLYHSLDGSTVGENYKEYALIRLDGEYWENRNDSENRLVVNKTDAFEGWNAWKEGNKKGIDVTVDFRVKGNRIITTTENLGISIINSTAVLEKTGKVYAALTGDQCAISNIRITGAQQ